MNPKNSHACQIFAHRGANKQAPENTRLAFDLALEYAIDGLETDVQLSRDGIPALWHDSFLDKLGLPGLRIDDFDLVQLEKMRFASVREPEGLLSLQDFINSYRGRCTLNIEVKNRNRESLHREQSKTLKTLQTIGASTMDDVFISSFRLYSLIFAHRFNSPSIPLFFILTDTHTQTDIESFLQEHPFLSGFCLPIRLINETIVYCLRDHDKTIVTYTCNSEAEISKALDLNVDILITDDPLKALQLRT